MAATIKLGDIGRFVSGGTPSRKHPEYFEGTIPWISTPALNGGLLDESNAMQLITEEAVTNSATKLLPSRSLLIGVRIGVGKTAINTVPMCTSQDIVAITDINEDCWDIRYLSYAVQAKSEYLLSQKRGATITGITSTLIKGLDVKRPSIEVQRRYVSMIDNAKVGIDCGRRLLAGLDELVKSRFVEVFENGDLPKVELSKGIVEMHMGPFGSAMKNDCFCSEEDASCVVYEQKHAIHRDFDGDYRYVDEKKHKELARFEVGPGDFIVSCRGTIGRVARIPEGSPRGVIHPSLMLVRIDESVFNPSYFLQMFSNVMESLENQAKGNCVKMAVRASELAKMEVPLPPLDEQDDYLSFVSQVDKSRFAVQQAIEQLELLKAKLMQEYFG